MCVCVCVYIWIFVRRSWLVQLWRFRNLGKLETQESQWCGSVWVQRTENQRNRWQSEGRRDKMRCPSSNSETEKKGESFSLLIFVLFRPSMDPLTPACTGEGNLPY